MLAVIVAIVLAFGSSSSELAAAYGIAVTGTMVTTTLLTFFVIRLPMASAADRAVSWRRPASS
jgi:K+ transporter